MIGYGNFAQAWTRSKRRFRAGIIWSATISPRPISMSAPQIGFGMMFGTIEKRPAFEHYWQRLSNRPAWQRARELDDAKAAELKKAAS